MSIKHEQHPGCPWSRLIKQWLQLMIWLSRVYTVRQCALRVTPDLWRPLSARYVDLWIIQNIQNNPLIPRCNYLSIMTPCLHPLPIAWSTLSEKNMCCVVHVSPNYIVCALWQENHWLWIYKHAHQVGMFVRFMVRYAICVSNRGFRPAAHMQSIFFFFIYWLELVINIWTSSISWECIMTLCLSL